jgi:hypothetical protein
MKRDSLLQACKNPYFQWGSPPLAASGCTYEYFYADIKAMVTLC